MAFGYFQTDGGYLQLVGDTVYPTTTAGLAPGAVWTNSSGASGLVCVVPGAEPNPFAPLVYFPGITPAALLALGGGNLPLSPGINGSLWNCGGIVAVSFAPRIFELLWATVPQSLQKVIKAYLYLQYRDDDNLQAFIDSFNAMAQEQLDWFNKINLPIYTNSTVVGELMDWVCTNLYGQPRPVFSTGTRYFQGAVGSSAALSLLALSAIRLTDSTTYYTVNDDIYGRIVTWNYYKGDGRAFTIPWLKRRIARFIYGPKGIDVPVDFTDGISVISTSAVAYQAGFSYNVGAFGTLGPGRLLPGALRTINVPGNFVATSASFLITLDSSILGPMATVLASAIEGGSAQLPFQYKFTVVVT